MKPNHLKLGLLVFLLLVVFLACVKETIETTEIVIPHSTSLADLNNDEVTTRSSPINTKWVKKKALRFNELLNELQLDDATKLLDIASDCQDRNTLATTTGIRYDELTMAVEIADLKRTGMSTLDAAILHNAFFFSIIAPKTLPREWSKIKSSINGQSQILDASLFATLPQHEFVELVLNFVKNSCKDCNDIDLPNFNQIQYWMTIAKDLDSRVSYECNCSESHCVPSSPTVFENEFSNGSGNSLHQIMISPANVKWIKKKALRLEELIEELGLKNEIELLNLAGDCEQRKRMALERGLDYLELTMVVELADLKRTGMSGVEAAVLHSAVITKLVWATKIPDAFIPLKQLIEKHGAVLPIHVLAQLPEVAFRDLVNQFVLEDCMDCNDIELQHLGLLNIWIEAAKQLQSIFTIEC